ncbi:hypothetical protein CEXT_477541 [Caerostris extrusa]|uniref:DNA topoisomerase I DNA binding eukaryotic-type domain-containing protein n=1 Tax=Caerostris extrusa TaxID=172846 RepID=A0AAV4VNC9_CAEEX|nr:hypothetical protein CEXT_477541 [Caerostris extrusa]
MSSFTTNRNHVKLSRKTEEVAGLYGRMLKDRKASKILFKRNFFRDWKEVMTHPVREKLLEISRNAILEIFTYITRKKKKKEKP